MQHVSVGGGEGFARVSREWRRCNTLRVLAAYLGAIVRATHFSDDGPLAMRLVGGVLPYPLWPALPWVLFSRALMRLGSGAGVAASIGIHLTLVGIVRGMAG